MASLHGPCLSMEAQGSISAMTFYRGRGNQCARLRWPGIERRSRAASMPRTYTMQVIASAWKNLSIFQREQWQDLADNHPLPTHRGRKIQGQAQAWFFRLQSARLEVGQDLLSLPPSTPSADWFTHVDVFVQDDRLLLTLGEEIPANHFVIVRQRRNVTAANQHRQWLKLFTIFDSASPTPLWLGDELGQPSTNPDWPVMLSMHWQKITITLQDSQGRRAPTLAFNVLT
jgi:hypothetical protein